MLLSIPRTLRAATPDLPTLPPLLLALLAPFLETILNWLSDQILRCLLFRCRDHPLVLLATSYDPAPVIAACAAYHHASRTKGAPPTFTIEQLVRAEIVRTYAQSCSDRELEWLLCSNLLLRWFVTLPLFGATPDHSTLSRFHAWVCLNQPDALFRDVLCFLDHVDPEDAATTPQIVDTFAMASPAAPTASLHQLLRQLTLRLIALFEHPPASLQATLTPIDLKEFSNPPRWHNQQERLALLQQAVTLAREVAESVTPHLSSLPPSLAALASALLSAIHKVIADETSLDASGYVVELPPDKKGRFRIMSALDLESSFRKHEGDPAVFGTNAVIATTATRIRAAIALTGSTPDNDAPAAVLRQEIAASQSLPPMLIMDQAGGHGKTRALVDAISQGKTMMVARIPQAGGADLTRFTPSDFRVDAERTRCTCPNGVTSTKAYRKADDEGLHFRFLASQCRDCPLWNKCRAPDSNPRGHRMVYITDHHVLLRRAAEYNASQEGKALLKSRWMVEPVIAWLVEWQGCRQARRIGLAAAQFQLYQASAVRNLLHWLKRRTIKAVRGAEALRC
jgi:hypothetical protein